MDLPLYPVAYKIGYLTAVILLTFQIVIQLPWVAFLCMKLRDVYKKKCKLEKVQYADELSDTHNHMKSYKHEFRRLGFFLAATICELLVGFLHLFGNILWKLIALYSPGNCHTLYKIIRVYIHVVIGNVLAAYFYTLTLIIMDILIRYHIQFYSSNDTDFKLKIQVRRLIILSSIIIILSLSGVGVIPAYIINIVVLLLIYYKLIGNTKRLYNVLKIKCEDLKYTNGENHFTTKEFIHSTIQFKRFKFWFMLCGFPLILYVLFGAFITLPLSFITEPCLLENSFLKNNTLVYSSGFNITVTVFFYLVLSFLICTLVLFVPILSVYTLIYFCNKLLFSYRYHHRYHIDRSYSGNLVLRPLVS